MNPYPGQTPQWQDTEPVTGVYYPSPCPICPGCDCDDTEQCDCDCPSCDCRYAERMDS